MNRSKFGIDKSKFEYMDGNALIWLDVDRIESVIMDPDNRIINIKMHSEDEFHYKNNDENEIIEAHYALTSKFRKDPVSRRCT